MNKKIIVKIIVFLILLNLFIGSGFSELSVSKDKSKKLNIVEEGYVAYWNLNEGEGNIAHDESQYGNHGEIEGASWSKGKYSFGLEFDGIDDYVFVQDDEILNFDDTNKFKIDLYIKWFGPKLEGSHSIIHKKREKTGYRVWLGNDGIVYTQIGNGVNQEHVNNPNPILPNIWYRITSIWDGLNLSLYINEELVDSKYLPSFGTIAKAEKVLEIGNNWGFADTWDTFYGIIDEIYIYDFAIFTEEITIHIEGPKNEEIVRGYTEIHGHTTTESELLEKVEIYIGNKSIEELGIDDNWIKAYAKYNWVLEYNFFFFFTGPLNIIARFIFNGKINPNMDIIRVHVDNNYELPEVNLTSHISDRIINGTVLLEGTCIDSDGEIEKVQIKIDGIHDDWEDTKLLDNDWWYELNTKLYEDSPYYFNYRAIDNESFFSPIYQEILWIDNQLPNFRFVTPQEGWIYILWEMRHKQRYVGDITIVIGDLPIQIDVTNDEVLNTDFKCLFLYLNDNFLLYNLALPEGPVYENSEWNHRCFGDCKITAIGINNNLHGYSKSISFLYYNL